MLVAQVGSKIKIVGHMVRPWECSHTHTDTHTERRLRFYDLDHWFLAEIWPFSCLYHNLPLPLPNRYVGMSFLDCQNFQPSMMSHLPTGKMGEMNVIEGLLTEKTVNWRFGFFLVRFLFFLLTPWNNIQLDIKMVRAMQWILYRAKVMITEQHKAISLNS